MMMTLDERQEMLLLDYACGALSEAPSLMIAAWLTLSPEARQSVARMEALGGALMAHHCAPVRMQDDSLRKVLNRLDRPCPPPRAASPGPDSPLPWPLCSYVDLADTRRWVSVCRGVRMVELSLAAPGQVAVMRLQPHSRTRRQCCAGMDMTLVLDGACHDERQLYRRGTLLIHEAGSRADLTAEREGCLSFVVSDSPGSRRRQGMNLNRLLRSLLGR